MKKKILKYCHEQKSLKIFFIYADFETFLRKTNECNNDL